jgi:hypothetical protein
MASYKNLCCDVCNKEFSLKLGPANNKLKCKEIYGYKIYCSKLCRDTVTKIRRLETTEMVCHNCNGKFEYPKKKAASRLTRYKFYGTKIFCSDVCRRAHNNWGSPAIVTCDHCGTDVKKFHSELLRNEFHFCNWSCAASYKNAHKTTGTLRSKLELWLEGQLSILYPNLNIMYCDRTTINSELDIYIPSLKIAFELNGIFHYEPIFGVDKLEKTQNNDKRKFQACLENGIELCIIDTSSDTYFKPIKCEKYLNIIVNIVDSKLKR